MSIKARYSFLLGSDPLDSIELLFARHFRCVTQASFFIYLNCQIKSVKEQQDHIGAKLIADYMALEEQINHFDVEVRFL